METGTSNTHESLQAEHKEKIEKALWQPGIFQKFADELKYGGSTNLFKEEIGLDPQAVDLKLLGNVERLDKPMSQKRRPARFLIELSDRIDPEADPHHIVKTQLKHTNKVVAVDEEFLKRTPQEKIEATLATDGLITNVLHHPLYISAADCTPVAIYDPENRAIGIFHSGWRGTAGLITVEGIKQMTEKYGTKPESLVISIGPSIAPEDFEVDGPVYDAFAQHYSAEEMQELFQPHAEGKYWLDVPKAIKLQLLKIGVKEENIEMSGYSTSKNNDIFPSARKAGGVQNTDPAIFLMSLSERVSPDVQQEKESYPVYEEGRMGIDKTLYQHGWFYVVDFEKSPTIQKLYENIKAKAEGNPNDEEVIKLIFNEVGSHYTTQAIDQVDDLRSKKGAEAKAAGIRVSLEDFVAAHTGNCSQTTLTAMLIFEKLKADGIVQGNFTTEHAHWESDFVSAGHVWGLYTSPEGKKLKIDIVRKYLGDEEGYKDVLKQVEWETLNNY
jgi:YfiH family protein